MKIRKILKKLSAFMLITTMLSGIFGISDNGITANASDNPVQMYFCDHQLAYHGAVQFSVYVQVDANSATNKAVSIHHKLDSSGVWSDTDATYVTRLDANTEIWKADIASYDEVSVEYAIKYIGDGNTYWDNNGGNNYKFKNILGTANVKAGRYRTTSSGIYMNANVKNLAPTKKVIIRYTLDNWNTYHDAELEYVAATPGTNSETWSIDLEIDGFNSNSFQYCVKYEVNGQTYWDNNFGANYDSSYNRFY